MAKYKATPSNRAWIDSEGLTITEEVISFSTVFGVYDLSHPKFMGADNYNTQKLLADDWDNAPKKGGIRDPRDRFPNHPVKLCGVNQARDDKYRGITRKKPRHQPNKEHPGNIYGDTEGLVEYGDGGIEGNGVNPDFVEE